MTRSVKSISDAVHLCDNEYRKWRVAGLARNLFTIQSIQEVEIVTRAMRPLVSQDLCGKRDVNICCQVGGCATTRGGEVAYYAHHSAGMYGNTV